MQAESREARTISEPGSGNNIFAFLILAFLFSWTLWVMAIQRGASTAFPLTNLLYLAGVFGPSVAGATMVSLVYSSSKRETFLRRIYMIPEEGLRYVAISVIMVPILVSLARIMSGILGLGNPVALLWDTAGSSPTNLVRSFSSRSFLARSPRNWGGEDSLQTPLPEDSHFRKPPD